MLRTDYTFAGVDLAVLGVEADTVATAGHIDPAVMAVATEDLLRHLYGADETVTPGEVRHRWVVDGGFWDDLGSRSTLRGRTSDRALFPLSAGDQCLDLLPGRATCSRVAQHDGRHVALLGGAKRTVCSAWPGTHRPVVSDLVGDRPPQVVVELDGANPAAHPVTVVAIGERP